MNRKTATIRILFVLIVGLFQFRTGISWAISFYDDSQIKSKIQSKSNAKAKTKPKSKSKSKSKSKKGSSSQLGEKSHSQSSRLSVVTQEGNDFASQMAKVTAPETQVYQNADFDAPVIAIIRLNQTFQISKNTYGPFYKIKLSPTLFGFVSDIDVKPIKGLKGFLARKVANFSDPEIGLKRKKAKRKKPIEDSRFRGLGIQTSQYVEDTMGKVRSESLLFYGFKVSGNNTFIPGDVYLDSSFMIHFGAPSYYRSVTGQPATGWIVLGEMIFETPLSSSNDQMIYLGFGPMIKYSHFDVSIKNNQSQFLDNYLMDDIAGGLVLNLGLALRPIDKLSFRAEGKYYFEQSRYSAINFGLQWEY